jgi:hypothetical protein
MNEEQVYQKAEASEEEYFRMTILELLQSIPAMSPLDQQIFSIDDEARKHDYQMGGVVPEFMLKFLENMKTSAEAYRQERVRELRNLCVKLRTQTMVNMAKTVFQNLYEIRKNALESRTSEASEKVKRVLKHTDAQRQQNEKALTPSMANPNFAQALAELCEMEDERYQNALDSIESNWKDMSELLRQERGFAIREFSSTFEVLVRLVDRIPLKPHFEKLDGDDKVEIARMSLKRLLRKKMKEHEGSERSFVDVLAAPSNPVDQSGEALPPRTWECLPVDSLAMAREWDTDYDASNPEHRETRTGSAEEDLENFTNGVESFRSPVHKALFKERNSFFEMYSRAFRQTAQHRLEELKNAKMKEEVNDKNWQSMLMQLTKGEGAT